MSFVFLSKVNFLREGTIRVGLVLVFVVGMIIFICEILMVKRDFVMCLRIMELPSVVFFQRRDEGRIRALREMDVALFAVVYVVIFILIDIDIVDLFIGLLFRVVYIIIYRVSFLLIIITVL